MAWIDLISLVLIMIGTVYGGYELLGGRQGPLGLLARTVTYSLMVVPIYAVFFGLIFGAIAGVGLGFVLALEYYQVSRYQRLHGTAPEKNLPIFGFGRGLVFGLASWYPFGIHFAVMFALFSSASLLVVYRLRFSHTHDYQPQNKPVISARRSISSFWRGFAIGISATAAALIFPVANISTLWFGIRFALIAILATVISSTISPLIEWWIDHLPDKWVAAGGVLLVLVGTLLQAVLPLREILHR